VDALTDVLNDHILPGSFRASFLMRQGSQGNRLSTLGGLALGFGLLPFQVNGIDIVISEVMASNGIVYVIDQVLLEPAPSITDVASANSAVLSTLVGAVVATGLDVTLAEDGPFTVFAPVNSAFDGVDVGSLTEDELRDVLLDHVVDGSYTRRELFQLRATQSTLVTKGGLELEFRGPWVNGIRVLAANISAGNGTIYLIEGVLLED
jgi:transforming growth factor-beta-induced protein